MLALLAFGNLGTQDESILPYSAHLDGMHGSEVRFNYKMQPVMHTVIVMHVLRPTHTLLELTTGWLHVRRLPVLAAYGPLVCCSVVATVGHPLGALICYG